ncbi:MAG: ABC transporter permease [Lachnospiraceae bacterium]|nr:ABC transporter permease [Lachnospiraceae bacterium]
MTVFKGYMKIIKRLSGMIAMYLAIFTGITFIMQFMAKDTESGIYTAEKLHIAVVDEDGGALAKGLADYLEKLHQVSYMENDEEVMQETIYYESVDLILRIPANFQQSCLVNGQELAITGIPGSYNSIYVSQQINTFLNGVRSYMAAGFDTVKAVELCGNQESSKVDVLDNNGKMGISSYAYTFRYMPYLFLSALCYTLAVVLTFFRKREVKNRMLASAVSLKRQNAESILAFGVVGIGMWLFSLALMLIVSGGGFFHDPYKWFYLLNSFILMLVCLAVSFVIGLLVNKSQVVNHIVTPLSLGMCFLCGVFVEMSLLGDKVLRVAQFLPIYWYEVVNETLSNCVVMTDSIRDTVLKGMGIEMLFAVALIGVALVISKFKQQEQ